MFSLLCAVWAWLTESADVLLDLANAGRDANNAFVIAIVSGLAIVRVAALLLFTVPAIMCLYRLIVCKVRRDEIKIRVVIIVIIVASVAFEIWAVPARKNKVETSEEMRVTLEGG